MMPTISELLIDPDMPRNSSFFWGVVNRMSLQANRLRASGGGVAGGGSIWGTRSTGT